MNKPTLLLVGGILVLCVGFLFLVVYRPDSNQQLGAFAGWSMAVEADIFSGRPNPTWKLLPQEAHAIDQALAQLPQRSTPPAAFDGLGYRGLIVRATDPQQQQRVTIQVYYDTVSIDNGTTTTFYQDSSRSIERRLIQSAIQKIPPDAYDALSTITFP